MDKDNYILADVDINMSQAVASIQELKKQIEVAKTEVGKFSDKSSADYITANANLKALNAELRTQEKILVDVTKAEMTEGLTVEKLAAENKKLSDERKTLNINTKEGADRIKEINDKINKNNDIIVANSDKLKQNKMNVGNYTDSVKDALKQTGIWGGETSKVFDTIKSGWSKIKDFGSSIGNFFKGAAEGGNIAKTAISGIGTAIKSTGIGLLLTAFASLVSYFTKSVEGSKALKEAFAAVGAVTDTLIGTLTKTGKLLVDISTVIFTGNWNELGDDLKSIGDNFANIGDNIKKNVEISKQEFQLAKDKRKTIVDEASLTRDIAKLRLDAADKTKSNKERIDALRKSLEKEKQLTVEKVKIAQSELDIYQKRVALSEGQGKKASKEDKDRIAELTAAKINAETEEFQRSKRALTTLSTLELDLLNETEKKSKEIKEKRLKNDVAIAEYKYTIEKEGTEKKLLLNIKYLEKKRAQELSNEDLTRGERLVINAKYNKEIEKAKEEHNLRLAEIEYKNLTTSIDLYIKKNKSKIDNDTKLTEQIVNEEKTRIETIAVMQSKQIEAETTQKIIAAKNDAQAIANIESEKNIQLKDIEVQKNEQIKTLDAGFKAQNLEALQIDLNNQLEIHAQSGQSLIDLKIQQLNIQEQAEIATAKRIGANTTLIERKYANAKIELVKAEQRAKMSIYANFAGSVADLLGENTKVGKIAAIAQATINTYLGATAAFAQTPGGVIIKSLAAATAVASGLASVKKIISVNDNVKGSATTSTDNGSTYSISAASSNYQTQATELSTTAGSVGSGIVSRNNLLSKIQQEKMQTVLVIDDVTAKQKEQYLKNKTNIIF